MTERQAIFCFIVIKADHITFGVSRDAKKDEEQAVLLCSGSDPYRSGDRSHRDIVLSKMISRLVHDYRIDEIQFRSEY